MLTPGKRVRLIGEVPVHECLQFIFGELVQLATPVVEHYHSDLYHDVTWLKKFVPLACFAGESFTFFYAVDENGTAIGTEKFVSSRCSTPRARLYQLTLECEGSRMRQIAWSEPEERVGTWYLRMVSMKEGLQ